MLLWREKIPGEWLPKVLANLDAILVDHCHLERKAAASALSLMKYHELHGRVRRLNAIAIEELEHFNLMLDVLEGRGIPLGQPCVSPWIRGLMKEIRKGRREQVIDHLICCSLIEGRSCEKFQVLADELKPVDAGLARLYGSLVESEANHYVDYWLMARDIDNEESHRRLDFFVEKDAALIRQTHDLPLLH